MLIGLMGLAGVGKSTAAKILAQEYGFIPLSFADSLKDGVAAFFGWPRNLLEGDTITSRQFRETPDEYWSKLFNKPITPRWALQYVGTELFRNRVMDDFWVAAVGKKLKDPTNSYVLSDVRFVNEIDFIKKNNGFVVEIVGATIPEWVNKMKNVGFGEYNEYAAYAAGLGIHPSEWTHVMWRSKNPIDYLLHNAYDEPSEASMTNLTASIQHMMRVFSGPIDDKPVKNEKIAMEMV